MQWILLKEDFSVIQNEKQNMHMPVFNGTYIPDWR